MDCWLTLGHGKYQQLPHWCRVSRLNYRHVVPLSLSLSLSPYLSESEERNRWDKNDKPQKR